MNILVISGSLRAASINKRLAQAWIESLPTGVNAFLFELHDIPQYNADLNEDAASVVDLKKRIAQSDGVAIATPEFNYGIPGVLKNALDWASRPAYKSAFAHKPVTLFGASPGPVGTSRAQGQLKQVLLGMLADIYPCPELSVGGAPAKFDDSGKIQDEALQKALHRHAEEFCAWTQKRAR